MERRVREAGEGCVRKEELVSPVGTAETAQTDPIRKNCATRGEKHVSSGMIWVV